MPPPDSDTLIRRTVHFSGRVQGVGFRYTVQNIAMRYDVLGYVRNLPDGAVELVLEGRQSDVQRILDAIQEKMKCFIGEVHTEAQSPTHEFQDFSIRH